MTEFYETQDTTKNKHKPWIQLSDDEEIEYFKDKLLQIEQTISQIEKELEECNHKFNKMKKSERVMITLQDINFDDIPNLSYDIDDSLMEITEDYLNNLLDEKNRIYSRLTVSFLNRFMSCITNKKFTTSAEESDYKRSITCIKQFCKVNNFSIYERIFDFKSILENYTANNNDLKCINLLNENDYNKEFEGLGNLVKFYKALVVESLKSQFNISPEFKELNEDIQYLVNLNLEKQEELRRCIIMIRELRDNQIEKNRQNDQENLEN